MAAEVIGLKDEMIKTTKKQFKLFCDEFKRQVKRMGLMEWRLDFFHERCADDNNFCEIDTMYRARMVAVFFASDLRRPVTDKFILESAKHEAIELLVDDAFTIAQSPFKTVGEAVVTRHTLVRRLEKLL